MAKNLMYAHREWASRPGDQRFSTLADLDAAVQVRRSISSEVRAPEGTLRAVVVDDERGPDIRLLLGDERLRMTHWAMGQVAQRAGVPVRYIRSIPAELAVRCLDYGLTRPRGGSDQVSEFLPVPAGYQAGEAEPPRELAYLASPGGGAPILQALTTVGYHRFYDAELVPAARRLVTETGFELPLGYAAGKFGAEMVPSGAYASDHDVFLFMVDYSRPVEVGNAELFRGFIFANSETGARSYWRSRFLLNRVCGNHIIWGASDVAETRIPHRGQRLSDRIMEDMRATVQHDYDAARVKFVVDAAQHRQVASNEAEAQKWLTGRGFTRPEAVAGVAAAVQEEGRASTIFDLVQGLTAAARSIQHMDTRLDLEARAGKLLDLVAA